MAKVYYLKLGEKAPAFFDVSSGVTLSGAMVVEVTIQQKNAKKVQKAFLGGHLATATEQEYKDWVEFEASTRPGYVKGKAKEPEEVKSPFDSMNTKALVKAYTDTYEVSDEELEEFKELDLDGKREFLKNLEDEG